MPAGIAIGSSEQISKGVAVGSDQVQSLVETTIVAGVPAFVAAPGRMADQQLKQQEGHFQEQVEQRPCDD